MSEADDTRVAVVTGGSRGIGRAVVEALAGHGWRVFFCSKSEGSVETAGGELSERFGDRVEGRAVDVRDQEAVDAFVAWVLERAGRIDCLVNNAGLGRFGPVDGLTGDEWREVLHTNLDGAFYCLRAVAPAMKRQGSGYVFNIASLAAKNPFAGGAAYNASKFGMLGFSEAAMLDLRHQGIRVSCILPGSVDTGFREGRDDTSWMLTPEDVARTVLDLLAYPERALPSRVELRPSKPPQR
jgi:NAD(P)-dependent dehydrogenase (short-subunit alcohol dehydrogenase family)